MHLYFLCIRDIANVFMVQVPYLLLTRPSKIEGSSISKKPVVRRKLSGGDELLKGFLHVHESCVNMKGVATPRRYMAFLHSYHSVYSNKKSGIETRQHHLQVRLYTKI